MSPKVTHDKQKIIDTAFEILRKQGRSALTVRAVADSMGCSTSPIYSSLGGLENLETALAEKTSELLLSYQTETRSGGVFFDMGLGYIDFARTEKQLFRYMVEDETKRFTTMISKKIFPSLLKRMKDDPMLTGFTDKELENVLLKMFVFVHGIAALANIEAVLSKEKDCYIRLLNEVGHAIITTEKELQHEHMHFKWKP